MRTIRRILTLMLVALVILGGAASAVTGDQDNDGVPDSNDNCVSVANPNQADFNSDGKGDACQDSDSDVLTDGYELTTPFHNPVLNTTLYTVATNRDTDADGWGDGFETNTAKTDPTHRDSDGDGWEDPTEKAAGTDPWSPDTDGDGVVDSRDNCAKTSNSDQKDTDADRRGDACDNCPTYSNAGQYDSDKDGIGDACDPPPTPPCDTQCQVDKQADSTTDTATETVGAVLSMLPHPDIRPLTDVAQMGSDGFVVRITQLATNKFELSAFEATGAQVAFDLPVASYAPNGPVAAFIYEPGKRPSEGSRVNLYWKYSRITKKITVKLALNRTIYNQVLVAFAAPIAGLSPTSCNIATLPGAECLGTAMAFYNPQKATVLLDALDAVPYPTDLR